MALADILNSKHFPHRSEIAGGLAGIAAGLLSSFLGLDAQTSMALVGAAMALAVRFVPDSIKDMAKTADTVLKDNSGVITDVLFKAGQK